MYLQGPQSDSTYTIQITVLLVQTRRSADAQLCHCNSSDAALSPIAISTIMTITEQRHEALRWTTKHILSGLSAEVSALHR